MIYLRARWYHGQTGRFASQDPWQGSIQQPSSLHKYLYVSANPVNLVDPTGLYDCSAWPLDLRPMCWVMDSSPRARYAMFQLGFVTGLDLIGWGDASTLFAHFLGGSGESVSIGSR